MTGKVYLVGAGPGDYRLISVRAQELVKTADAIVYDRLADDRLLRRARADAELIYVGKASSRHTMRQEEISRLLVDKAKEGKTVVRLKGGDPFVFGRGGEEALLLFEHQVPFEVVPGVTSAISVPAYAGIPVTHRNVATSFAVVTGHEDPTKAQSSMRWDKLALAVDTLVFLMGVENLPHITEKLVENGKSPDTPAAIVRWGTKPEQSTLVTTLGRAAEDARRQSIKPPAIFIVGDVVNLREKLAWFDNRPLFGKTVLVTRARDQASLLTERLEALGASCIEAPAIRIAPPDDYGPLDAAIAAIETYQWTIFTSPNGVDRFFARLLEKGRDSRAFGGGKIAAIGVSTAKRLRAYGLVADVVPVEFKAEGILAALEGKLSPGDKILIPRASEARAILPEKLREMGAAVDVVPAYRTLIGDVDEKRLAEKLQAGEIDLITFTSSSTVTNLLHLLGGGAEQIRRAKVACIGPITGKTCIDRGIEPDIMAKEYTIAGLAEAIERHFAAQS